MDSTKVEAYFKEEANHYVRLVAVCILLGLLAGLATYLLDLMLHSIGDSIIGFLNPKSSNPLLIVIPVVGVTAVMAYIHYSVKIPLAHGTERINLYLKEKNYVLPARLMWDSVLTTSVTLGFGGSAGAEGPSAFTGAAIGSNLGRLLRLGQKDMRLLIGIGAGAGIAGIFRSPLGGVLFTLEILRMPLGTLPVLALISSCLCAGLTSYLLNGQHYDVALLDAVLPSLHDVPYIVLLGIFCGLYSLYYAFILKGTGRKFDSMSNRWLRAVLSGLMIGVAIYIFPSLYATGYDSLGQILNGNDKVILGYSAFAGARPTIGLITVIAMGIVMTKPFACAATNYGGGVAGNFAPTLFTGGFLGYVFASLCNTYLGMELHAPNFIYLGMAGAMAGIIRAPLMAMFLTCEMSGHSDFLWPLALVSLASWTTARLLAPKLSV